MDSGNSGSLQSSSGDEEFDSRADAISAAVMNNPASASHVTAISNNRPPPPSAPPQSSIMFDPLSNYFEPMSRTPHQSFNNTSSILNLDMAAWSKTLRSEPNCTEINNNSGLPSSSSIQSLFVHQGQVQNHPTVSLSIPQVPENTSATNTPRGAADQPHAVRNPKKRSRASRRAPTTVLTTDTTNFRAMVQEFTGIPAPPFTASSPFPRARLDLYGTPSGMRSNHPLDNSQPSYLRRPFPQKVQLPPPFLASSSSSLLNSSVIDHAIASSNTNNLTSGLNINTAPNATSSLNYQLSSELALLKHPPQSSSLFNVSNPILTSLLQSNPAKTSQGLSMEIPSNDSRLKMSFLDDFGLSHGGPINPTTLSGLPGLISSDQTVPRNNNENSPLNWGNGIGSIHENDQCQVRNTTHSKLNFSSSSSSFPGEKGPDNVAAAAAGGRGGGGRGEGMMESWICSSD